MTSQRLVDGFAVFDDRVYAPSHLWIRTEPDGGDVVSIGIDDYLQQRVGLITAIRLPEVGSNSADARVQLNVTTKICEGERCEYRTETLQLSVPVDGEVVAVNEHVTADPFLIQEDHADRGWLIKVRLGAGGRGQLAGCYHGGQADDWLRQEIARASHT